MMLHELAAVSAAVAATRSRSEKVRVLAECLRALAAEERATAVDWLSGVLSGGKVSLGPATVHAAQAPPAAVPSLTIAAAASELDALRAISGKGSAARREQVLARLLGAATALEQEFLVALLLGELRQGALEGVMAEAIATAAGVEPSEVRRASMLAGGLAPVASAALASGRAGIERFRLTLYEPLAPMLASPAKDVDSALAALGAAVLEHKLDGARVQIHKGPAGIRVFSRTGRDVTASVPEVERAISALPTRAAILDGEVLALTADGRARPFQDTMRRFGRKLEVASLEAALPLSLFAFDCLHFEGEDLIDRPLVERLERLAQAVPPPLNVARLVTRDRAAAQAFLDGALALGHEGMMAKAPGSLYEAGSRGAAWLKIKVAHTLDLVVLAAEWGNGRRQGWLSNLHLGARDPAGGFVMLGKTFKGLTDELLEWQTAKLKSLAVDPTARGYVVEVVPELVVEIAFNELQISRRYPGGLALRFARVVRYRPDKRPEDADTIDTVRAIAAAQRGVSPPSVTDPIAPA
jgi:DNA ligase-1